jgi:hypothetical protein
MSRQIHRVVKDSHDFDHMTLGRAIHDEMSPASAMPRDMKGSQVGTNFFPWNASRHVRTGIERGKRLQERRSVNVSLARTKRVLCIFENAREIFLSLGTKANPPARRGPPCRRARHRQPC